MQTCTITLDKHGHQNVTDSYTTWYMKQVLLAGFAGHTYLGTTDLRIIGTCHGVTKGNYRRP